MCVLIEKNIMHMHCNTSKYRIEIVDHVKIFKVYDELQYVNCNSTHTKIVVPVLRKQTQTLPVCGYEHFLNIFGCVFFISQTITVEYLNFLCIFVCELNIMPV